MDYGKPTEHEHLHSLALMNQLDLAQHSDLLQDVRAHLQGALNRLFLIHEHLEESIPLIETSGARRDAEKAKEHISIAIDLAREALDMPYAKLAAAVQECREHVEVANRQMSRAGMDAII